MAYANISRYPNDTRPALLLPPDDIIPDGTPGPIFRYSGYTKPLAEATLVTRVRFCNPVLGHAVRGAFGAAIRYSSGIDTDKGGKLLDEGKDPLILGRTGESAIMHAALLVPNGDISDNMQPCVLLSPTEVYQEVALASVRWPEPHIAERVGNEQVAQSIGVLAIRLNEQIGYYS